MEKMFPSFLAKKVLGPGYVRVWRLRGLLVAPTAAHGFLGSGSGLEGVAAAPGVHSAASLSFFSKKYDENS